MINQHLIDAPRYSVEDVKKLVNGRDVYVWGAGLYGKAMYKTLIRNGFSVDAFLDKSQQLIGHSYKTIPIIDANEFLEQKDLQKRIYVFCAGGRPQTRKEMVKTLADKGFETTTDCISMRGGGGLNPYVPSIDVSGACNFKCICCPRSNKIADLGKHGFMSASYYEKVIKKLLKEIPWLTYVELYLWGEPFLNPELPEIVKIGNDLGVGCFISTNLSIDKNLEAVIKQEPLEIKMALTGYGDENFSDISCGSDWNVWHKNLMAALEYKKIHKVSTRINVYYHIYEKNLDDYAKVYEMCNELGVELSAIMNIPFLDYVMDYFDGKTLPDGVKKNIDYMFPKFDERMDLMQRDSALPCVDKYSFPNIYWDLSVFECTGLTRGRLANNFMDVSLQELITKHNNSDICKTCVSRSLHRWAGHRSNWDNLVKKGINDKLGLPMQIGERLN